MGNEMDLQSRGKKIFETSQKQLRDGIAVLTESLNMVSELYEVYNELTQESGRQKDELQKLSSRALDLEQQIERQAEREAYFSRLELDSSKATAVMAALQERSDDLQKEREDFEKEKDSLEKEKEKLEKEKESFRKERESFKKENEEALQEALLKVEASEERMREAMRDKIAFNAEYSKSRKDWNKKKKEFKSRIEEQQDEIKEMKKQEQEYLEQITGLQSQMTRLQDQLRRSREVQGGGKDLETLEDIEALRKEVKWYKEYANDVDNKIKEYFNDKPDRLNRHYYYLSSSGREGEYREHFSESFLEPVNAAASQEVAANNQTT